MIIDMFLEPEKTNPIFALALISICLIGALGTWFSATVILSELTLRAQHGERHQVWLTNECRWHAEIYHETAAENTGRLRTFNLGKLILKRCIQRMITRNEA